MAGRPPTPTPILKAQGTFREDRHGSRMEVPAAPAPELTPPAILSGDAKDEWVRVAAILQDAGVFAIADKAVLLAYCDAYAEFVEAMRHVSEEGRVLADANEKAYPSPWVKIKNQAAARLEVFASKFGLTPVSRAKVKVEKKDAGTASTGKTRFFAGRKD